MADKDDDSKASFGSTRFHGFETVVMPSEMSFSHPMANSSAVIAADVPPGCDDSVEQYYAGNVHNTASMISKDPLEVQIERMPSGAASFPSGLSRSRIRDSSGQSAVSAGRDWQGGGEACGRPWMLFQPQVTPQVTRERDVPLERPGTPDFSTPSFHNSTIQPEDFHYSDEDEDEACTNQEGVDRAVTSSVAAGAPERKVAFGEGKLQLARVRLGMGRGRTNGALGRAKPTGVRSDEGGETIADLSRLAPIAMGHPVRRPTQEAVKKTQVAGEAGHVGSEARNEGSEGVKQRQGAVPEGNEAALDGQVAGHDVSVPEEGGNATPIAGVAPVADGARDEERDQQGMDRHAPVSQLLPARDFPLGKDSTRSRLLSYVESTWPGPSPCSCSGRRWRCGDRSNYFIHRLDQCHDRPR